MINTVRPSYKQHDLHSTVQNSSNFVAAPPAGAILLDSLKTLELQLQTREMLNSINQDSINPLWFVAETERNVFLWRAGYSLIDSDRFEFWVDIPALVNKRLKQLENYNSSNPFLNSLWGASVCNPDAAERERDYLIGFREIISSIAMHASALSSIASMIRQEVLGDEHRALVVLPGKIENSNDDSGQAG